MPDLPRRFPCGEFFPGEEPRTPPNQGASNSIPPIFIPTFPVEEPPFFPPTTPPDDPKWACILVSPGELPQTQQGGDPAGMKKCLPCTGRQVIAGALVAIDEDDEKCIHGSLAECTVFCRNRNADIPPVIPTSGPGDTIYQKCVETPIRCPPPDPTRTYGQSELDALPLKQILRSIVACTLDEASLDIGAAGGFPFDPTFYPEPIATTGPDAGYSDADDFCMRVDSGSTEFWAGCVNSDILADCIVEPDPQGPVTPGGRIPPGYSLPIPITPTTFTSDNSQSITSNLNGVSITNPQSVAASIINLIPQKQSTQVTISNNNLARFSSASGSINQRIGLFDDTYNFFKTYPPTTTTFISNSEYLNIFNSTITEEVSYFLRKNNSTSPWHEKIINSLTNDKIILSLRTELLIVMNNLHGVGNEKLNFNNIITSLKSHLISGKLDEFDPNYYFHVYNSQINDALINVVPEGETPYAMQSSLAIFELSSKSPDYSQYSDLRLRNDVKRMRVLLEDIEANISTLFIDGVTSTLYLKNAGVPTTQVESPSAFMNIGDGAGYYLSSLNIQNDAYPLVTVNELSSSKYLAPFERHIVLRTLGTDPGLVINVSSNANHEFTQNYNPSADVAPMYFALDFDKLGDIISTNSVVNILSATYRRLTDEEGASHSRNYSFNIIKINLDHRDPLVHYARDTSTISVELDDFNLRAFDENRTPSRNNIILRNVPAAVIIAPGLGSAHNPFNGRSTIINYGDPVVVRSLNITPSPDVNNTTQLRPPVQSENVYNTIGTPYFGLYEKLYDQDIHGDIFTYNPNSPVFEKSYFYNGSYSNLQPPSSLREGSIESKLAIDVVDKLANLSGVADLTYWDVYRRLSINDIGKLSLISPRTLMKKLESGWRNGIKIKYVLSRAPIRPSGIPEGTEIPNDLIILNERDRNI